MSANARASNSSGRTLQLLLVVIALGVGGYYLLPGLRTRVDQQLEKVGGWNDAARRHDPVGFIDFSITKLETNIGKFDEVKGSLAIAKVQLAKLHEQNASKLAFAGKQLDEFKGAFKAATGGKGWPVDLAGKSYSEADLKQQVNLLLNQKSSFESVLKQTQSGLDATGKREMEIVGRVTESRAKLDLLKTQRELVKVAKLTADTEKLLGEVHDVLIENEALSAENPVRTVEELMKQAESGSSTSNANVDAFLNG